MGTCDISPFSKLIAGKYIMLTSIVDSPSNMTQSKSILNTELTITHISLFNFNEIKENEWKGWYKTWIMLWNGGSFTLTNEYNVYGHLPWHHQCPRWKPQVCPTRGRLPSWQCTRPLWSWQSLPTPSPTHGHWNCGGCLERIGRNTHSLTAYG